MHLTHEVRRTLSSPGWEALLAQPGAWTPFCTPEWVRACARIRRDLRAAPAELWSGGQLVGIAPFMVDRAEDLVLGVPIRVTDYASVAHLEGDAERVAGALVERVVRDGQRLILLDAPQSPLLAHLARLAEACGLAVRSEAGATTMVLDLSHNWDAYLGSLPKHDRHELRRKSGRARRCLGEATVRVATPDTLGRDLDSFAALFRASGSHKEAFLTARTERFFREVAVGASRRGTLRLSLLECGDDVLAATLGFEDGETFWLYNACYRADLAEASPGHALVTELIKTAIERGLTTFDFLRGEEPYKARLGARPRQLHNLTIEPIAPATGRARAVSDRLRRSHPRRLRRGRAMRSPPPPPE
ncbi:MAG: GNAT family N-acetyltransferase [Solirubrobacteraceae bacterium]